MIYDCQIVISKPWHSILLSVMFVRAKSVIHMHKQTYACFSLEDFTGHFQKRFFARGESN